MLRFERVGKPYRRLKLMATNFAALVALMMPRKPNRTIHLGKYSDEEQAARAFDAAAREFHGEFARTNFPACEANAFCEVEGFYGS